MFISADLKDMVAGVITGTLDISTLSLERQGIGKVSGIADFYNQG